MPRIGRRPGHFDLLWPGKADDAQPAEGRVQAQFPVRDLLLEKGVVVLCGGKVEHRVVGVGGLDDGKAGVLCPATAAHHLRDEAEHVLVGAEALCEQQRVDAQHAHKGHVLKIQALGHHLGAHHDVVLVVCKLCQQFS